MSESKHTPGPWITRKGVGWYITRPNAEERREAAIAVGTSPTVTLVGRPGAWFDHGEAEANARLMAAAPELLEAVKALLDLIEAGELVRSTEKDHEPGWAIRQLPLMDALAKAANAIAKTEGRQ